MKSAKRKLDLVMDRLENLNPAEEAAMNNVFDRIDQWHDSQQAITLAAYLGWSDAEYRTFVERCEIPEREYENQ